MLGCHSPSKENPDNYLQIAVASSLMNVIEEIVIEFNKNHSDISLQFIYGSSTKLRKQIEQGAPVDIFLSASQKDIEGLVKTNNIIPSSVQYFAQTELVLVTNKEENYKAGLESLFNLTNEKIVIGEPENVPLGRYTKEMLEQVGLWEQLKDKFVYGASARQVTTYVNKGHAEFGIVYKPDVFSVENIRIIYSFVQKNTTPIVYPGAIVATSSNKENAEVFMDFLMGSESQAIMKSFGFDEVK